MDKNNQPRPEPFYRYRDGCVCLIHDRLVWRRDNGRLLHRCSSRETMALLELCTQMVQRRVFCAPTWLPIGRICLTVNAISEQNKTVEIDLGTGDVVPSLPISAIIALTRRLMDNLGREDFLKKLAPLQWDGSLGRLFIDRNREAVHDG